MKKICLIAIFIAISGITKAQKKWIFNPGIGLPKLLHISLGRKISNNNQVKLSAGLVSTLDGNATSLTLEHDFLIKKSAKFENSHTWYFGQQLIYLDIRNTSISLPEPVITQLLGMALIFGRQINFNPSNGLNLELGPLYYYDATNDDARFKENDITISGSLGYFLKF